MNGNNGLLYRWEKTANTFNLQHRVPSEKLSRTMTTTNINATRSLDTKGLYLSLGNYN